MEAWRTEVTRPRSLSFLPRQSWGNGMAGPFPQAASSMSTLVHLSSPSTEARGVASFSAPGLGCVYPQVRVMVTAAAAGMAAAIHHQALRIHRVSSYPHHRLRVGSLLPLNNGEKQAQMCPRSHSC